MQSRRIRPRHPCFFPTRLIERDPLIMQTRKWQPSGFIKASAVAHAGALAALAIPGGAAWSLGALIANHAALTAAGLWPRSSLLGPNILRLDTGREEVAITIDDGPNPDV